MTREEVRSIEAGPAWAKPEAIATGPKAPRLAAQIAEVQRVLAHLKGTRPGEIEAAIAEELRHTLVWGGNKITDARFIKIAGLLAERETLPQRIAMIQHFIRELQANG